MQDNQSLAKIFRALANPQRLAIFERLGQAAVRCGKGEDGTMCVCDIAGGTDLALSTVSHHLKELREAGLIRCERRGQWVYCKVNREALEKVEVFLKKGTASMKRARAA